MAAQPRAGVSERELEVLTGVVGHLTNAQIAARLHLSVRTVESHVSTLLRKLDVSDRRELAQAAGPLLTAPEAARRPVGIPARWTSLVGRTQECADLVAAVGAHRLVTLVGPGGVGKTRLVVEITEQVFPDFAHGAGFVDLVPVRDGAVLNAVASAFGATEVQGSDLETTLQQRLGKGRQLLVLDNCEHVLGEVADLVQRLLASCPELVVLATSRERLGLPAEHPYPIHPLTLEPATAASTDQTTLDPGTATHRPGAAASPGPDHPTTGPQGEAQVLFLDRARQAMPGFDAHPALVHQLCAGLEGMPLAIELAAARAPSLGVEGLLTGLADPIRLLQGARTADTRHRSVSALIDWSYQLLTSEEQHAFLRLSIFAGPFDLTAAHHIIDTPTPAITADLIGRLADKNLLAHRRSTGENQWRMIDTIRAFAAGELATGGQLAAVRERHLRWAAEAADQLDRQVSTDHDWRTSFDVIAPDLIAALANAAPDAPLTTTAMAHGLARSLAHLTYARGFPTQGRSHYETAAELTPTPSEAARDLIEAAHIAHAQMQPDATYALFMKAAALAAGHGDTALQATALAGALITAGRSSAGFEQPPSHDTLTSRLAEASCLDAADPRLAAQLAVAKAWIIDPTSQAAGAEAADAAVAASRTLDDPVLLSAALDTLAGAAEARGDTRRALAVGLERFDLIPRFTRHDPRSDHEAADILWTLTFTGFLAGDIHSQLKALKLLESYESVPRDSVDGLLVSALVQAGDFDQATTVIERLWDSRSDYSPLSRQLTMRAFIEFSMVCGLRGEEARREQWRERGLQLSVADGVNYAGLFYADARVALHRGDLARASQVLAEGDSHTPELWNTLIWDLHAQPLRAEVEACQGHDERLNETERIASQSPWGRAVCARARGLLLRDRDALLASLNIWESLNARYERASTLLLINGRVNEGLEEMSALGCVSSARLTDAV